MKGVQIGTETETESTFHSDLNEAHECENRLKEIFEQNYNCSVSTSQAFGSFPDWDLKVLLHEQDYEFTIELKQDKMVWKTGNIAVEYQRTLKDGSKHPTCISVSKATIWAYYFNSTYYLIPTETLRQIIQDKLYFKAIEGAGDGNRAGVYLFQKDVFLKYATDIKEFINKK